MGAAKQTHSYDRRSVVSLVQWRKNMGGLSPYILAVFEGNGSRPSHKGPGISTNGDKMYTLNSTEVHGVVYELPRKDRAVDGK